MSLNHPIISKVYELYIDELKENIYIVMEYVTFPPLSSL